MAKNQDAANAFRDVELLGDYVNGSEKLPADWKYWFKVAAGNSDALVCQSQGRRIRADDSYRGRYGI